MSTFEVDKKTGSMTTFIKKNYNSGSFRRSAYQGKRANKRRADEDAD